MTAVDQQRFGSLVEQAVGHLYDLSYLQTHPLGGILVADPARLGRGRALQSILIEAIQALQPSADAASNAHAWRAYRYLFLRYVQALPPVDVARELLISERQSRRTNREALGALVSLLWDRYRSHGPRVGTLALPTQAAAAADPGQPIGSDPVLVASKAAPTDSSDLVEVIEGINPMVRLLAQQRGGAWTTALAPSLPRIQVARSLVRQILLSLCSAVFAQGSGHLRLSADHHPGVVRLAFEFVSSGDSDRPASAAPGDAAVEARLATGRGLVEAAGGVIEVRTADDGAMVVVISLPAIRGPTVLIIEDNPDVTAVFRRYLEGAGLDVLAAPTGAEGLRLAQECHPAAITLDVMMTPQSGWETLQLLKNHPETHDIPVLVCSVLREGELARFLGAADLLAKPVTRPALLAALARHVAIPSAAHQSNP